MTRKSLRILLIIYTFLLPFQTRLFLVDSGVEYQRVSLYGTQILFFIILIAYFFCHSHINGNPNKNIKIKRSFVFSFGFLDPRSKSGMTAVLVICFIAIQLVVSSRIDLTFQTLLWIIQTILFIWIIRREKLERTVLWTFVISMCAQSVFIWTQVFTQYIPAFKWLGLAEQVSSVGGVSVVETTFGRFLRGYGSFPHPNIAGGWLLIAIIAISNFKFSILNFQFSKRFFQITLYASHFTLYALMISALVLTFSRSAMLGLIIYLVIAFVVSSRSFIRDPETQTKTSRPFVFFFSFLDSPPKAGNDRRHFLSTIHYPLITLLFFLAIAIPFRDLVLSRADTSNRLESRSVVERQLYSGQAKAIIKDNLWFGVGLGNYTLESQRRNPNLPSYAYQPPHSAPLLALAELGIVGIAVLLLLLFFSINKCHCEVLRGNLQMLIFTLPVLPLLFFDHYLWSLYPGWILVGCLGLLCIRFRQQNGAL